MAAGVRDEITELLTAYCDFPQAVAGMIDSMVRDRLERGEMAQSRIKSARERSDKYSQALAHLIAAWLGGRRAQLHATVLHSKTCRKRLFAGVLRQRISHLPHTPNPVQALCLLRIRSVLCVVL